jgi:hypothetical protein
MNTVIKIKKGQSRSYQGAISNAQYECVPPNQTQSPDLQQKEEVALITYVLQREEGQLNKDMYVRQRAQTEGQHLIKI